MSEDGSSDFSSSASLNVSLLPAIPKSQDFVSAPVSQTSAKRKRAENSSAITAKRLRDKNTFLKNELEHERILRAIANANKKLADDKLKQETKINKELLKDNAEKTTELFLLEKKYRKSTFLFHILSTMKQRVQVFEVCEDRFTYDDMAAFGTYHQKELMGESTEQTMMVGKEVFFIRLIFTEKAAYQDHTIGTSSRDTLPSTNYALQCEKKGRYWLELYTENVVEIMAHGGSKFTQKHKRTIHLPDGFHKHPYPVKEAPHDIFLINEKFADKIHTWEDSYFSMLKHAFKLDFS